MPVTAADVRSVAFNAPPMGKPGYDAADVDVFLGEVERELVRLAEEYNDLRAQVERGRGMPAGRVADPRLAGELGELTAQLEHLQREKAAAEQAARAMQAELVQMRAQAARAVGGGGGQQALGVLTMAQRTADDHVGDARREADELLSKARSTAEEVTRHGQVSADALERDARQQHQEAMAAIDAERTAAQTHIAELKEFERQYRTQLAAHLEGLLRDLAGRGGRRETDTGRADNNQPAGSPAAAGAPMPTADPEAVDR